MSVAMEVTRALVDRAERAVGLTRLKGESGGPYLQLTSPEDPSMATGWVEVLQGDGSHAIDRVIQIWLGAPGARVDSNLVWVFANSDSPVPHYHAQAVHMPGDVYVYNFDLMPRVDMAVHDGYWREVFGPLSKIHGEFSRNPEHAATRLPIPPSTGVYLSPWGLAGFRAQREELDRAIPVWNAYLDRVLDLGKQNWAFEGVDSESLRARDRALVAAHTSDELDPRGWGAVRKSAGDASTERIKALMSGPLADVL